MGLPLGVGLGIIPGILINESSINKSTLLMLLSVVHIILSLCLPAVLVTVPRAAFCITLIQGIIHNIDSFLFLRITTYWTPDNENTIMTSIYNSAYLTGRMGVMFIGAPLASYVHWSAPSVVLGATQIFVTAMLSMTVS